MGKGHGHGHGHRHRHRLYNTTITTTYFESRGESRGERERELSLKLEILGARVVGVRERESRKKIKNKIKVMLPRLPSADTRQACRAYLCFPGKYDLPNLHFCPSFYFQTQNSKQKDCIFWKNLISHG